MTVQPPPDLYSLIAGMRGQTGFSMPVGWSDDIGSSFLGAQAQVGSAALQSAAQMAMQDQTNRLRFAELMGADASNNPTDAAQRWRQELGAQQAVQNQRMAQELGQMMGTYGGQQTLQAQGQQAEIARQRALMLGYDPSTGQRTMDSQRLAQEAQQAAYERAMRQQLQTGQQGWQTGESALDRALRESLQAGQQGWTTQERLGTQGYQTGERLGTQQFQTGERLGTQQFQAGESAQERELRRQLQAGELNQREQEFARTYILQQEESRRQQAELSGTMEGGGLTEAARAARAQEAARIAELSGQVGGGLTEQSRAAREGERTQRAQIAAQLLAAPKDVFKAGAYFKALNGGSSPTGIGQGGVMGFNSMANRMTTPGTVSLEDVDAQIGPGVDAQQGQTSDDQAYGLEAPTPGTAQTTPTETGANAIGAGAGAGTPAGGLPTPPPAEPLAGAGPGGPVGGGNAQGDALAQIQALLGQQQANALGQTLLSAAPVAPTAPVMAVAPVPTPQMAPAMPAPPAAPAAPGAGQVNFGSEPAGPVGDTAAMVRAGLGGLGLRTGPAGPLGWEYEAGPYMPSSGDSTYGTSFDDDVDDDGTWDNEYGPYMPGPKPSFLHPYYRAGGGGGGDDDDDDDDVDVTPGPGPGLPPLTPPDPIFTVPPGETPPGGGGPENRALSEGELSRLLVIRRRRAQLATAHEPDVSADDLAELKKYEGMLQYQTPATQRYLQIHDADIASRFGGGGGSGVSPAERDEAQAYLDSIRPAPGRRDLQPNERARYDQILAGDANSRAAGSIDAQDLSELRYYQDLLGLPRTAAGSGGSPAAPAQAAPPPEPPPEPNNVNDPNNNGPGGPVGNAASLVQAGLGDLGLGIGAGGSFVGRQPAGPVGTEVGKPIPYVNPDVYEDPQVKSMLDDIKETSRGTGAKDRRNGKEVHGGHEFGEKAAEQRSADNDQFTRVMKRLLQQHMGPGGPVGAPLMPEGGDTAMPVLQDPGSVGAGGSSFAAPSGIASVDPGTQEAYKADLANKLRQGIGTWAPQSMERRSATEQGLQEGAAQALGLNPEDVMQAYRQVQFANTGNALSA